MTRPDLDVVEGRSFDHYARLVHRFVRVPVALVTLVESDRQVFAGALGLPQPFATTRQTPLSHSFCQYVVADRAPLVVADARSDDRLAANRAIPDLQVIAYAGWPLTDADGTAVGSLCAIDHQPRTWSDDDLETLRDLARACSTELGIAPRVTHEAAHRDGRERRTFTADDAGSRARLLHVEDDLVATVSHELRTPLTSIVGNLELLADELEDPSATVSRTLATIERNARRLQARIAQLLDTAERRRALALAPTDLSSLVAQLASTFAEQATAAGVTLVLDAPLPQPAVVDHARIEQAVENLVGNALKYTDRGGTVTIHCDGGQDEVRITIADDGIGMTDGETARAFDSYWRADAVRRTTAPGVGIGLSLVRDILHAHGGTVSITSEPGSGTTCVLTVPRAAGGEAPTRP